MISRARRFSRAATLLLFALAGAHAGEGPPLPDGIANASYSGTEYGTVTLTDGVWEGEAWVEGGALFLDGGSHWDAARTAQRLQPEVVYLVYRRSRLEMPARIEEIHHAEEEGAEIL